MKTLLVWLALLGAVVGQDASTLSASLHDQPVMFLEVQQLWGDLRMDEWTKAAKSSAFNADAVFRKLDRPPGQIDGHYLKAWKAAKKQLASLLERPEGKETELLKLIAKWQEAVDANDTPGSLDLLKQVQEKYDWDKSFN